MRLRTPTIVPIAIATGLLLIVAIGPTPDSSATQSAPDAAATEISTFQSAATRPPDDPTPSPVREAPSAGTLVARYLDDRFGPGGSRTAWHANIRSVAVRFGTVIVQTDLSGDPGDTWKVSAICGAVLEFQETGWGQQMDGLVVEVYDPGGRLLAQDRARPPTPMPSNSSRQIVDQSACPRS